MSLLEDPIVEGKEWSTVRADHDRDRDHPAVKAWRSLQLDSNEPALIAAIRNGDECVAVRLAGVLPGGFSLIAKPRPPVELVAERMVYEQVLPQLPIFGVGCHGYLEEQDGLIGWLFLDDAGGTGFSTRDPDHRTLAGRWLGRMHTFAVQVAPPPSFPRRGSDYYREQLRVSHDAFVRTYTAVGVGANDRARLRTAAAQCEYLGSHWSVVAELCESVPQTLVHGDFAAKNARIRGEQSGAEFVAFDWEVAHWGPLAIDLAQDTLFSASPDLVAYWSEVRRFWPHLELGDIRRLAELGSVFRVLVAMSWDASEYRLWEWAAEAMPRFHEYCAALIDAVEAIKRWE